MINTMTSALSARARVPLTRDGLDIGGIHSDHAFLRAAASKLCHGSEDSFEIVEWTESKTLKAYVL